MREWLYAQAAEQRQPGPQGSPPRQLGEPAQRRLVRTRRASHRSRAQAQGNRLARARPRPLRRHRAVRPPGLRRRNLVHRLLRPSTAWSAKLEPAPGRRCRLRPRRSTILMAEAFPLDLRRLRLHEGSIDVARDRGLRPRRARRATSSAGRAPAPRAFSGSDYDLVTMFDFPHDMGDPSVPQPCRRASLAADGTWMIVEPDGRRRVEDNPNRSVGPATGSRRWSARRRRAPRTSGLPSARKAGRRVPCICQQVRVDAVRRAPNPSTSSSKHERDDRPERQSRRS